MALLKEKSNAAPEDKDPEEPVSERCYRKIFLNDFIISPFHPKKDQSLFCERWNNRSGKEKDRRAQEKMKHDRNKKDAEIFKERLKD